MRSRWRLHLLILLAYTALALTLTWPLVAHLGTHVPGNGSDDPPLTWNLWWVRHAILDLNENPFLSNFIFYPLGINLAFYTLTVSNGLLSIPLQGTVGLIAASNILLLSSFVLSGYGAFLLAEYLLGLAVKRRDAGSRPASCVWLLAPFAGGLLYAFASCKLFYAALGQWNIASSQWIPFYVLYLLKAEDEPRRWQYPLLAALFLLFQAYAELTYASFLILFTLLRAFWHAIELILLRKSDRARIRSGGRWFANLIIIAVVLVVGLAPILAKMIPDLRAEGDILSEGGGFADVFSADLLGFLMPTMLHPVFGHVVDGFHFDHTVGQQIFLGYTALALALVGIVYWERRRRCTTLAAAPGSDKQSTDPAARTRYPVRFWSVSTLVWWLLTLGPTLRINGYSTRLWLPFSLLEQLPFFKGNRYPSRFSVLLVLSLAMLVAFALAALADWAGTRRKMIGSDRNSAARQAGLFLVAPLLVLLMLFEHLSIPLPLSDMRVPPVYQYITAGKPGDWTLLDVPVAWRNGSRVTGTLDPIIMFEQYYQTAHQKRILAGNTSRNPSLKFQYFTEAPVINSLIALETGHKVDPAIVAHDRSLAADVLRFFNIGAIVVHPAKAGPDVVPYVEAALPASRIYEGQGTVGYAVQLPPWPDAWSIEPGQDLARLSYAEGWGVPAGGIAWAQRNRARLLVPLNGRDQRIILRAYAPGDGQQLVVQVNGQVAQTIDLSQGWKEYATSLPASQLKQGLNDITLQFSQVYPTEQVRLSPRTIGTTGVESPVNLTVQSAGEEVGDFGLIYVDGRQVSPNGRGYNVAVIDPTSGSVEATAVFDTHLDQAASQSLARFLNDVPAGRIVAVAVADEGSRLLGQEAIEALRGIGAAGDLRGKFRWGHAVIGVRGAPAGSAVEAIDWIRPVSVVVGEGATETHLAAGFGTISFASDPRPKDSPGPGPH